MRVATFSIPFALARPAVTTSGAFVASIPNIRGGSRTDTTPDMLGMPGFTVGMAIGRLGFRWQLLSCGGTGVHILL